jgi:hypothetical protein
MKESSRIKRLGLDVPASASAISLIADDLDKNIVE